MITCTSGSYTCLLHQALTSAGHRFITIKNKLDLRASKWTTTRAPTLAFLLLLFICYATQRYVNRHLRLPAAASAARSRKSVTGVSSTRKRAAATTSDDSHEVPRGKRARASTLNVPPAPVPALHVPQIQTNTAGQCTMGTLFATQEGLLAAKGDKSDIVARKLFVWGTGEAGQLSLGGPDDDNIHKLTKPKPFGNKGISADTDAGELGPGGPEVIAAGGMHSLLIDANGRILSCGSDDHGTLARQYRDSDESEDDFYYVLRPVEGISPSGKGVPSEQGKVRRFRATRVAASDGCSIALNADGELVSWGHFKDGEGKVCFADTDADNAPREQWTPVPVPSLEDVRFAQVVCGENHVLALTLDGRVYSWGLNSMSQLGRFANLYHVRARFLKRDPPASMLLTPEAIPELKNIVRLGCGLNTSFAVDADGRVFAWGLNTRGQTGTGLKKDKVTRPTRVKALDPHRVGGARVVQVAGGEFHTAFLLSNGDVWICGDGDEGKLGLPETHEAMSKSPSSSTNDPIEPVQLRTPVHVPMPGTDARAHIIGIAAGMRFTFALAKDGTLYSWGTTSDEAMGQPAETWGDDQSKSVPTPVPMPGEPGSWQIVSVATAGQHSLALAVRAA